MELLGKFPALYIRYVLISGIDTNFKANRDQQILWSAVKALWLSNLWMIFEIIKIQMKLRRIQKEAFFSLIGSLGG